MLRLLLMLLSFSSSSSLLANRLILKNSSLLPERFNDSEFTFIKQIPIGSNTYTVIETSWKGSPPLDFVQLEQFFQASKVFYDLPISINIQEEKIINNFNTKSAWHVDALNYASLPPMGKKQIIVAVLDTGVEYTHSALAPKMWKNIKEIPHNKIDDDQNGFIDDYDGFDFTGKNSSDPRGTVSHGTHCAGIIVSSKQKNGNAQGVAPDAKIMALKVIGRGNTGFFSDAVEGIYYAVDNGAHILSNSWRMYKTWSHLYSDEARQLLRDAIQYAQDHDVIFVAAAGNESKNNDDFLDTNPRDHILPAGFTALTHLFVVASATKGEQKSSFSNFGENSVHIAAPGSDIISTTLFNSWGANSGTSMATPLVAGALARALSHGMSAAEAMEKIQLTTNKDDVWKSKVLSGHINLLRFLKE